MTEASMHNCVSCGAQFQGNYCPECGERRITDSDRSVLAFLRRAFEEVTDVDSRLLRTFKELVLRPGALTRAFSEGRRKPFLGPVQLFLLANLAYFLIQPLSSYTGYNTPLDSQLSRQVYSDKLPVADWVAAATAGAEVDANTFEVVYNNQSELLARSLVVIMVPILALWLALVAVGRGKPFVDHVVFALHFYAFDLIVLHCVVLMVWPHIVVGAATGLQALIGTPYWLNPVANFLVEGGASLLITVPYLFFAYRRFYGMGTLVAMTFAIVSLFALQLTTVTYRLVLLLVSLATV
ncbi:MAG: DUF3667 domain-containing protein [Pseudomonadota bacterium]